MVRLYPYDNVKNLKIWHFVVVIYLKLSALYSIVERTSKTNGLFQLSVLHFILHEWANILSADGFLNHCLEKLSWIGWRTNLEHTRISGCFAIPEEIMFQWRKRDKSIPCIEFVYINESSLRSNTKYFCYIAVRIKRHLWMLEILQTKLIIKKIFRLLYCTNL